MDSSEVVRKVDIWKARDKAIEEAMERLEKSISEIGRVDDRTGDDNNDSGKGDEGEESKGQATITNVKYASNAGVRFGLRGSKSGF
ncbi:MAG: hypothetical protein NZO16_06045 [Deltaproteobacteria bacterium]|nr:hypothetical protein [Deltaproteobacteria bacterium]